MLLDEVDNGENIYEMIDLRVHELRSRGVSSDELEREMEKDIEQYFKNYIHNVNKKVDTSNLENIIEPEILRVVEELISFSEERLRRRLSERVYYGMAVHVSNSIERIRKNKRIINPQLNKIRMEYGEEFNVALDCLKIIDRTLDVSMPIDEAGFLAMFFVYDERKVEVNKEMVKVIVVAHGTSTATSMAEVANKLLGVEYAVGINAPLDEKPYQVISRIKAYLKEAKIKSDVLFLVDMGSLTTFGKEIEQEMGIRTRYLSLVSTLHVIEATRKAIMGFPLDEVYKETLNVNSLEQNEPLEDELVGKGKEKLAIITICTTGEGSAITLKNLLYKQLKLDSSIFEIIPVNLIGKDTIYTRIRNIKKEYKIAFIVSSFKIDTKIPQFSLQDVLNGQAIDSMQRRIDLETTYMKMGETLGNQLKNINGEEVLKDIRNFNNKIEEEMDIKIDTNYLIGVTFHLACMIDRLMEGAEIDEFEGRESYIKENAELYEVVRNACSDLNDKYDINIVEDEICYIMSFFNYKSSIFYSLSFSRKL